MTHYPSAKDVYETMCEMSEEGGLLPEYEGRLVDIRTEIGNIRLKLVDQAMGQRCTMYLEDQDGKEAKLKVPRGEQGEFEYPVDLKVDYGPRESVQVKEISVRGEEESE